MTEGDVLAAIRRAAEREPTARVVDGDDYRVEVAAPGLAERDFRVEVRDRLLRVSGPDLRTAEPGRTFEFLFRLPDSADARALEAHFHDGVLAVRAPKAAATPRAVEVEPE